MTSISPAKPCCETCSAPLETACTGRPRRYCSHRCRTAAWRERDALRWSRYLDQLRATLRAKGDTHDR